MNSLEIIKETFNKKPEEFKLAMLRLNFLYKNSLDNGKLKGFMFQMLFNDYLNIFSGHRTRPIPERKGQPSDEGRDETDLIIDDFKNSLKTTNSFPQITTNLTIRKRIDTLNKDNISDRDEIKFIFESFVNDKIEIFVFDFNQISMFYFDKEKFLNSINVIVGRNAIKHKTFFCLDRNSKYLSHILYGTNQANAFQRGMWVKPNENKWFEKNFIVPVFQYENFSMDEEKEKREYIKHYFGV